MRLMMKISLEPFLIVKNMIKNNRFSSMILYGPPGSGKTSLANIISSTTDNYFVKISAVTSGTPITARRPTIIRSAATDPARPKRIERTNANTMDLSPI